MTNPAGVWKLLDSVEINAQTGGISRPRGNHPSGILIYSIGGSMCAIVTAEGRVPLETDLEKYTMSSSKLFHSLNSYGGTYQVNGNKITHKVQVASNPAWIGTDQIRSFQCNEDILIIDATITLPGQDATMVRLTWQRVE
jgi:hypothetical protein